MLEEFIYSFLENRKKILGGIIGFVVSILFISFGLLSTLFIVAMTILGYNLGNMEYKNLLTKFKELLSNMFNKIDTN